MSSSEPEPLRVAIVPARDMDTVRGLFREYAARLGLDLSHQHFAAELAGLPGRYAPPGGTILLAVAGTEPAGCVALRRLGPGRGEMKRLFVRPAWTGRGLGRRLATAAIDAARERGYAAVRLDTLASMTAANALYHRLGFTRIDAYCFNPLPGALFYELRLDGADAP